MLFAIIPTYALVTEILIAKRKKSKQAMQAHVA